MQGQPKGQENQYFLKYMPFIVSKACYLLESYLTDIAAVDLAVLQKEDCKRKDCGEKKLEGLKAGPAVLAGKSCGADEAALHLV